MKEYSPCTDRIVNAARNVETAQIPLYEHLVGGGIMEKILGKEVNCLYGGDFEEKKEWVRRQAEFYRKMGYDFFNYELNIGRIMPGSGALEGHVDPAIKDRADFEKYPWDRIPDLYFEVYGDYFEALKAARPDELMAIGGPGNGVFECVQDLTGYENLCYIKADDEELYADLFRKIGETNFKIWERFLKQYGDCYAVFRFGDDLGFKNSTLLSTDDINDHIIPQYKKIVDRIHQTGKPFILHSCGCIFDVMDDIITKVGIDAKHSNEDEIAPFWVWVERYGDKIGNFGGIDTDAVCRLSKPEMRDYITEVVAKSKGHGGFAFGSGNSIPDYVPVENYIAMNEIIREIRGE